MRWIAFLFAMAGCGNVLSPVENTVLVTSGAPPVRAVKWQASDGQAVPVTITIVPETSDSWNPTSLGLAQFRGYADLTWGVGAASTSTRIDVGTGLQDIAVTGSSVTVDLGGEILPGGTPIALPVTAWIVPGIQEHQPREITRTLAFVLKAKTESDAQPIPPFATKISTVWGSQSGAIALVLNDYGGIESAAGPITVNYENAPIALDYPLADGIFSINALAGTMSIVEVVFSLNL